MTNVSIDAIGAVCQATKREFYTCGIIWIVCGWKAGGSYPTEMSQNNSVVLIRVLVLGRTYLRSWNPLALVSKNETKN